MRGFDAWLTHNPMDDLPEPREQDYEDAREDLICESGFDDYEPTDEEIAERANQIMAQRIEDSRRDAEEHAAESRYDDMMDRYGDGPY